MHGFSTGFGTGNFPCHPDLLRKILTRLNISSDDTFLDIGCGKGRALVVAARFPFKRIVGVDIVRNNIDVASKNMNRVGCVNCELHCIDALQFKPDYPITVLFVYNPFNETKIVDLIKRFEPMPRFIIFCNVSLFAIDGYSKGESVTHPLYPNFKFNVFQLNMVPGSI